VLLKNFSVLGVHWGLYRQRDAAMVRRWMVELLKLAEARQVRPVIWRSLRLAQAAEALAAIASRESYGKVVLVP
jgi:NADPH:quinone reductase